MISIVASEHTIPADELRDGDWAVADFGDQLVLTRYQDSLVQGDFRPVNLSPELLALLGFTVTPEQPEGNEADIFSLGDGQVSAINGHEFIFEGGAKGRVDVKYLHLLQQIWRQTFDRELITDFLEQPHNIIVD